MTGSRSRDEMRAATGETPVEATGAVAVVGLALGATDDLALGVVGR
jgi:hypothetical protein